MPASLGLNAEVTSLRNSPAFVNKAHSTSAPNISSKGALLPLSSDSGNTSDNSNSSGRLGISARKPNYRFMKKSHNKYLVGGSLSPQSSGPSRSQSQTLHTPSNKTDRSNDHFSNCCSGARPPFITTVTRGKFLPSKFDLLIEKSLFTFASRPRPVGVTRHKCSMSSGPLREHNPNSIPPRGVHDYYNMMYDPHIFRGRATTTTASPPKGKPGENETENKPSTSDADGKSRKKRATTFINTTTSSSANTVGRNRHKITTRVTTRTKGLLKLVDRDRTHIHAQTDQFLQDLSGDVTPEEKDAVVQTDSIYDLPIKNAGRKTPPKNGVDAETQILPGELISFDEELQPIVESLVGKILQMAMMETMEEEEIAALEEQKNKFLEKRKREMNLLRQLQEEHEKMEEEKERLKQQLAESDLGLPDRMILNQALRSASISQPSIPTSYLIELLPSVINSLRQEGYLNEGIRDEHEDSFSPFHPIWQSPPKAGSEGDGDFADDEAEREPCNSSGSASVHPEEAKTCQMEGKEEGTDCENNSLPMTQNEDTNDTMAKTMGGREDDNGNPSKPQALEESENAESSVTNTSSFEQKKETTIEKG